MALDRILWPRHPEAFRRLADTLAIGRRVDLLLAAEVWMFVRFEAGLPGLGDHRLDLARLAGRDAAVVYSAQDDAVGIVEIFGAPNGGEIELDMPAVWQEAIEKKSGGGNWDRSRFHAPQHERHEFAQILVQHQRCRGADAFWYGWVPSPPKCLIAWS